MKKNLFMVAAVALFATVSCNKEEFVNNDVQGAASKVVFVAELEQPNGDAPVAPAAAQTKTALGEAVDGVRPVTWVNGDAINVNGVKFTTADSGDKATFTTTSSFAEAEVYTAIYPATAGTSLTAVTIPASQTGTFAEAAISVAASDTELLNFKNVASILKFQVPAACKKVTIESTSDLAGTFGVTFDDQNNPKIGTVSSASKKITITASFVTGKDYYVSVLPGSHKFTIRLDGYLSKASTTAVTTSRAKIGNLKTLPALEKFDWGLVGQHQGWNITSPTPMYKVHEKVYATLDIKLQSNGFKFAKLGLKDWNTANTSFGAWKDFSEPYVVTGWYQVYTNNLGDQNKNLGVADWNKKYDVYIKVIQDANWGQELKYNVVEAGTSVTLP